MLLRPQEVDTLRIELPLVRLSRPVELKRLAIRIGPTITDHTFADDPGQLLRKSGVADQPEGNSLGLR
jgi:hypothetical protein